MLKNSRYIKAINTRSKDVITSEAIDNDYQDVQAFLNEKINAGYYLYIVNNETNMSFLTTKAPGKYLLIWSAAPSGTYTFDQSYTYGSGGSRHTDIIITGIIIKSGITGYIVDKHTQPVNINFGDAGATGYSNITSLQYINCTITVSANRDYWGLYYKNSIINIWNRTTAGVIVYLRNNVSANIILAENVQFNLYTMGNTHFYLNYDSTTSTSVSYKNCSINHWTNGTSAQWVYLSSTAGATPSYYWAAINCKFLGNITIIGLITYYFTNCLIGYTYFGLNGKLYVTNTGTVTNIKTIYTTPLLSVDGSVRYYNLLPAKENQKIIDGKYRLTYTDLTSTGNYKTLYAAITSMRKSVRNILGTIKRYYYALSFSTKTPLDDDLKYLDENDLFLVWRDDLESQISVFGTYLYTDGYNMINTTGGSLSRIDYRNDESFLILIEDTGSKDGYNVLAWHQGQIKNTIYGGNLRKGDTFKVVRMFQIFEMPESLEYKNVYNFDDAPIDTSITVQDITSKVVR